MKILSLLLSVIALAAQAQTIIPKAGVTHARIDADGNASLRSTTGFTIGAAVAFDISKQLSLQPELNFIQKGSAYENDLVMQSVTSLSMVHRREGRLSLYYLEMPVLAKFTFGNATRFFINTGPSLGIGIGGNYKTESFFVIGGEPREKIKHDGPVKFSTPEDSDDNDALYADHRLDVGLQAGTGVIIADKIMVEFRYSYGLSSIIDQSDLPFDNTNSSNRVAQLVVGYVIR